MTAFFTFIAREDEAYRLVFTAGMDHDEAVAARLSQFHSRMATAIAELIVEDTGQPIAEATMIGHGLIGMATQAARHWNRLSERPPMEVSAELAGLLAWKGISGFPRKLLVRAGDPQATRPAREPCDLRASVSIDAG
ncbi:hypothetical protein [Nesterenkonia pannonica]|uniref:hypothetical protein n=1 Tax=Nesterenkonia pannonica TaxID=1548602 RepID=UPI002164D164|nr:hypothetical protein [Nesterenkonia pannonica]